MPLPTTFLRIATGALLLAAAAGCSESRKEFAAQRKAEAAGYRLEHFEREKLLFVHRPDGEKDGIALADLRHVFLQRTLGKETVDGKPRYWWQFDTGKRIVAAPFFGGEPGTVIALLRAELPGFDEAGAQRMASVFEKNAASYCLVWASTEYLKETGAKKEAECRP